MIEDTYLIFLLMFSMVGLFYSVILRPLNLRYQSALNRLLAKEIARSIYQKLHPEFTYDTKYRPDDLQSQLILSAAMEEFKRICQQEKEDIR
ncbi:hypothetical protein SUSP_002606 [Sulfurospirillum sp. 'SP']|nr:hypothetical protein [Sulfurospirillum sp. 'SP']WNZ00189.1 hypothetical protein SUSP_002606 [Sulfurospirillum sp. 'SP']